MRICTGGSLSACLKHQHWLDYFGKNLGLQIRFLYKNSQLIIESIPSFDTLFISYMAERVKGHLWLLKF